VEEEKKELDYKKYYNKFEKPDVIREQEWQEILDKIKELNEED